MTEITPENLAVCLDPERTVEERARGILGESPRTDADFSLELRFADAEAFVVEAAAKDKFDEDLWRKQYLRRTTDEKLRQRLTAGVNLPDIHFSSAASDAIVLIRQSPRATMCNLLLLGSSVTSELSGLVVEDAGETRFGTFTTYQATADQIEAFAVRPTDEFGQWRPNRPEISVFYSFEKPRNP